MCKFMVAPTYHSLYARETRSSCRCLHRSHMELQNEWFKRPHWIPKPIERQLEWFSNWINHNFTKILTRNSEYFPSKLTDLDWSAQSSTATKFRRWCLVEIRSVNLYTIFWSINFFFQVISFSNWISQIRALTRVPISEFFAANSTTSCSRWPIQILYHNYCFGLAPTSTYCDFRSQNVRNQSHSICAEFCCFLLRLW